MSLYKSLMQLVFSGCSMVLLDGCYKDTSIFSDTSDEITRTVSFTNDILPIFNNSCNSSGCHNSGGKSPDLTASNAFNALSGGNFINTAEPQNSEIFQWMTGKRGTPMPVSGINKDYNALIVAWIKQGANNN
ncbi:MAG: hypothetical protein SH818_09385 [Saprospiraceae bacterium]|nr:hypothetical protein [Saprospiraceae bacterium]